RREPVELDQYGAGRVLARGVSAAGGAARADRKVAFAERGEEVRKGLERQHHAVPDAKRTAGPHADDEEREGPLHSRRVVARPEKNQRDESGGEARGEGEEEAEPGGPKARRRGGGA